MIELCKDIVLLESANQINANNSLLGDKKWKSDYALICKKHNIDTTQMKTAFDYYQKNPKEFSDILEKVISELQKLETSERKKNKSELP